MSDGIPHPPSTPRGTVVDVLHGERIADPYRWLEDGESDTTRAWTDAQNARTRSVLDRRPERDAWRPRLRELVAVGLLGVPRPVGGAVFSERRRGEDRQAVLAVRDGRAERALVDPNALDASGLLALDWWYVSPEARYVAYGLSRGGTELSTLQVVDVASGRDLGVRIPRTQRSRVAWAGAGFYYTVHPAPGTVAPGEEHYHRRIRYHRLGDDPQHDEVVFGEGRPKEDILSVDADVDGRWALFAAYRGWVRNDLYLLDRRSDRLEVVVEGQDGLSHGVLAGGRIWIRTNLGSPRYRIDVADPSRPRQWRTVVPEGELAIESFAATGDHLLVHRLDRACSRLALYGRDAEGPIEIAVPGRATVTGPVADPIGDRFGYTVQSFAAPPIAYLVDGQTATPHEVARLDLPRGFDPEAIAVDQETYRSRDGTPVTLFLVHRRDVRPSGDVPTVLTGYGGFSVAWTPLFSPGIAAWTEAGGLYAVANLRGGSEHGEAWHRAGMRENKQNVFDDFHAAAEALIARGWTSSARLGIAGGSNGGLLVGAALTQRPELFAAAVCTVPLLDMLRYERFLIARLWSSEYGSAEDAAEYRWLRAYSPYHRAGGGVRYPALLLTTAEGDSRVDPSHARKMAALLQHLERDDPEAITLLRVDREAGHGIGKPLDRHVDDLADQLAFLAWRLGLPVAERMGRVASGR